MTRMLIIGPPGSGKGTQAERMSARLGVVAISTGEIFRAKIRGQTRVGLEARNIWTPATSFRTASPIQDGA